MIIVPNSSEIAEPAGLTALLLKVSLPLSGDRPQSHRAPAWLLIPHPYLSQLAQP